MKDVNRSTLSAIVTTLLGVTPEQVTDELSPVKAENWDSLNHLNLCVAVGQEFGVDLSTDEMASIRSVGDLVRLLNAKGVPCA